MNLLLRAMLIEKVSKTHRMRSSVHLSSAGLANIPFDSNKQNFEFIVGDIRFRCDRFVCDFLSPKLARLHLFDNTQDYYYVETDDPNHQFGDFLALGFGQPLIIDSTSVDFFSHLSAELENTELRDVILQSFENSDVNFINMLALFQQKQILGVDRTCERRFLSSHFFEFESHGDLLDRLDCSDVYELLSDHSLKIPSDDWLLDIVLGHFESVPETPALLEFVQFRYLSMSSLRIFVDHLESLEDELPMRILRQILDRLLAYSEPPSIPANCERYSRIQCPFVHGSPLKGIIASLTQSGGRPVYDQGIIDITSSSVYSEPYVAKCAADLENCDTGYASANKPNQWLRYDFKERQLRLTAYTIRSWFPAWTTVALISWVIEGSTDGVKWTEVDRQVNSPALRGNRVVSFEVSGSEVYRFIQVRQIGKNGHGSDCLVVSAFELFGVLSHRV
jgi:hypothetical protein